MIITQHPSLPNHWYVGPTLVAGAASAEEAMALMEELTNQTSEAQVPVTADDVRREASTRMQALLGARDAAHLEILVTNATREAVRLLRKGPPNWTETEARRAEDLERLDRAIEAIRGASNVLEADPPADYRSDHHWPASRVSPG